MIELKIWPIDSNNVFNIYPENNCSALSQAGEWDHPNCHGQKTGLLDKKRADAKPSAGSREPSQISTTKPRVRSCITCVVGMEASGRFWQTRHFTNEDGKG